MARSSRLQRASAALFIAAMIPSTAPKLDCDIHKAEFIPAEAGFKSLNLPLRALAASPMIYIEHDGKSTRCSSAIVSDRGHILTAAHCLDHCLRSQGAYKMQNEITRVDKGALQSARCTLNVEGVYVSAKVVAVNDCPPPEWVKKGRPNGICTGLDYAVLELEGDPLKDRPCLQVSDRAPKPGQTVMAIGHPTTSSRSQQKRSASDSDGSSQYISLGKTLAPKGNCQLKVDDPGLMAGLFGGRPLPGPRSLADEENTQIILNKVESGALVQASADILQGSSGGPLVGRYTGRIVGISSFYAGGSQGQQTECAGATFFSSAAQMYQHMERHFPSVAKTAFACKAKALTR